MVEGPPFLGITEHPWGFEHRSGSPTIPRRHGPPNTPKRRAGQTQPADEMVLRPFLGVIGGRRGKMRWAHRVDTATHARPTNLGLCEVPRGIADWSGRARLRAPD